MKIEEEKGNKISKKKKKEETSRKCLYYTHDFAQNKM